MLAKNPFVDKLLERIDRLDRTALEATIRDLAEKNVGLEEMLESANEAFLLVGRDGKIIYFNRQASLWLGLNEVSHHHLKEGIEDEALQAYLLEGLKSLHEKKVRDFELISPRELHARVFLIPMESLPDRALILIQDMTQLVDQSKWEEKTSRIESLVKLASGVAHEIGNPLNAIGIHLALLKKQVDKLPAAKKKIFAETLDVLKSETARLDRIVRNFLTATRKPPLRFQTEDLNKIIREALHFMGPELKNKRIHVQFHEDGNLPYFLLDRERLYQSFINIIKNAMEAMPDGGNLTVALSHRDKAAMIRFRDEGGGIAEKDLPKIFDVYFTTKEQGSGLGLMTVFNAVREHGGRVEVSSKLDEGTTFTIILPIRKPKYQLPE